ncbi:MAG: hypothetical protein EBU93_06665 [Chlamydiae bacterium]|nr:hypothetical protein [Chlamydiota bacterium]
MWRCGKITAEEDCGASGGEGVFPFHPRLWRRSQGYTSYTVSPSIFRSIHMIEKEMIVDYQICSLNELSAIIQDIQIKNFLRLL